VVEGDDGPTGAGDEGAEALAESDDAEPRP